MTLTLSAGSPPIRRVALVTSGFDRGGGVPAVARWLRDQLTSAGGYAVDVHDLATSKADASSRRLAKPASWLRRSLRTEVGGEDPLVHWGANAVELETMRYRPRRELLRELQTYDLIQVVSGSPAWASAAIGAGVPIVLQCATFVAWERERLLSQETAVGLVWRRSMTALTARVERHALRDVDAVLVENAQMLQHVESLGQTRVLKAPPGVDTAFWLPATGGWLRDGYLLSVCRLDDPRKGIERTVQAYEHLVRADRSIPILVIAGQGSLAKSVVGLLAELGLSARVRVAADLALSELAEVYRGASVFMQASYEEGLGLAVLEAMASGLPVVATETAGTRETVVEGVTGWLVPQGRASQVPRLMAARVLDVLRGDGATMSGRARERCEKSFSNYVTFKPYMDVYEELSARNATRKRPDHTRPRSDCC
jgi:glycosyltransferase involved in cell wall biosynthesis